MEKLLPVTSPIAEHHLSTVACGLLLVGLFFTAAGCIAPQIYHESAPDNHKDASSSRSSVCGTAFCVEAGSFACASLFLGFGVAIGLPAVGIYW
jgi:hypothetical protein